MIVMSLKEIARVVGGEVHGKAEVNAPASLDSRSVEPGGLFAALVGEHVDGHDFVEAAIANGAAAALTTRPVGDAPVVVVDDVTEALGRLARHVVEQARPIVVAITGSQGKTSVKDLLAQILSESGPTVAPEGSYNNELGVPLTALHAELETSFLIVEMGARGPGHIAQLCRITPPHVSVVLNVGHAHVGEFGSQEAIAQAKGEIVEALPQDGEAVLNADDPRVAAMASRTMAGITTFGVNGEIAVGDVHLDDGGEPHFTLSDGDDTVNVHVPQVGAHHAINAAAAAAAALVSAGLRLPEVAERLGRAKAVSPMRMARQVRDDGLVVIDDAYNANPESVRAALDALVSVGRGRTVAVLGEMLEMGDESHRRHVEVGEHAAALGVDRVIAVGPGAAGIAEGAGERGTEVADVDEALRVLSAWLTPTDVVLVKASRGVRLERVSEGLLAG